MNMQHLYDGTVFYYRATDSTNKRAKLFAEGTPDGVTQGYSFSKGSDYLFAAGAQSSGRGRLGRSFLSDEGRGLYISYLFSPGISAEDSIHLTTFAALCVHDALWEVAGLKTEIKWVNDILARGKKLAGILTEGRLTSDGMLEYAIIGIGINLKKMPLPPELRDVAVSVEELTGHAPDPELLFRAIAGKLRSFDGRRKDEYLCRYRSLCVTLGKEVSVIENGASYPAIARSIDSHGRLAVDLADGSSKTVDCADVSIRPIK